MRYFARVGFEKQLSCETCGLFQLSMRNVDVTDLLFAPEGSGFPWSGEADLSIRAMCCSQLLSWWRACVIVPVSVCAKTARFSFEEAWAAFNLPDVRELRFVYTSLFCRRGFKPGRRLWTACRTPHMKVSTGARPRSPEPGRPRRAHLQSHLLNDYCVRNNLVGS